jgi:hypothetical protein
MFAMLLLAQGALMPILGVAAKKVAEAVEEAALDSVKTKRAKSSKGKTARKTKAKSKSGSAVFVALIAIAIVILWVLSHGHRLR